MSVISLSSGKFCEGQGEFETEKADNLDEDKFGEKVVEKKEVEKVGEKEAPKQPKPILKEYKSVPPFPSRLRSTKGDQKDEEILGTFCKVVVNIHLLDIIKQIPCYANFCKHLCISKKKLKINETIKYGENISTILRKRFAPKVQGFDHFIDSM